MPESMETLRINRYLSSAGVASRREADRLIEAGRVTVDGHTAGIGEQVTGDAVVCVDGQPVQRIPDAVILAYYKPRGVVCTARDAHAARTVMDELKGDRYVKFLREAGVDPAGLLHMIGRLDRESEGLLLLTNDAKIKREMERPDGTTAKEYRVSVDQPLPEDALRAFRDGMELPELRIRTKPCEVFPESAQVFRIILHEGKNRQIRRMCAAHGLRVMRLVRIREGDIELGNMKPGDLRSVKNR